MGLLTCKVLVDQLKPIAEAGFNRMVSLKEKQEDVESHNLVLLGASSYTSSSYSESSTLYKVSSSLMDCGVNP